MLKSILPLAIFAFSTLGSNAQEIVTLTRSNPSVTLNPTDLVRIIGGSDVRVSMTNSVAYMMLAGSTEEQTLPTQGMVYSTYVPFDTMSGLTWIRLGKSGVNGGSSSDLPHKEAFLVLQVTKQGQQLLSDPLVTPGAADAKYEVTLETSTDMVTWVPTVPGEFLGATGQRFFRVRAVVK